MLRLLAATVALLIASASPALGQDLRSLEIHGFGGWSFGDTDVNRFLGAEPNGEYSKTNFAMKLTGTAIPSVQINAQMFFRNGFDGSSAALDYAFVDWQLSNDLHLRIGKVKHPFGIYSEVAGLGTVRPFLNLPQAIYGPIGLVSKSYRGMGLRGTLSLGSGWGIDYDLYAGGIEFEQEESALDLLTKPLFDPAILGDIFESEAVVGSRAVFVTPVDGLRVGGSFYSGRPDAPAQESPTRYRTLGTHVEYVVDRTWIRAEYVKQRDRIAAIQDRETAYYVEAARFLTDHLQIAAQYSWFEVEVSLPQPLVAPEGLTIHEENALGLNYWVTPEFGFKASVHWVRGNLIAELAPQDFLAAYTALSSPHPRTRLFQFGAQFSF
jgi:hypothetical protein